MKDMRVSINKLFEKKKEPTNLELVRLVNEYLTGGELPDGVVCKSPKLSKSMAYRVIWFLQEVVRVLPASVEMCHDCGWLYDSDCEGFHVNDDDYKEMGYRSRDVGRCFCGECHNRRV